LALQAIAGLFLFLCLFLRVVFATSQKNFSVLSFLICVNIPAEMVYNVGKSSGNAVIICLVFIKIPAPFNLARLARDCLEIY